MGSFNQKQEVQRGRAKKPNPCLDASLSRHSLPHALLTLFQRQAQPAPVTLYDLTQPF